MTGRERARWVALVVDVPAAIEDELSAEIGAGSLGVLFSRGAKGWSVLEVCLPRDADVDGRVEAAAASLAARGLSPEGRVRVAPIPDGRWVERYLEALLPLPIGDRFVVLPPGASAAPAGRETLRLVPGRAFGTGEHPTTRLSAAALERAVRPGSRWLDLGTGSGILAVVAARCGAGAVEAVDVDADAVEAAREAVLANGVEGRVRVRLGSVEGFRDAGFDGCVANVASAFFLSRSAEIASCLRFRGALLASGVLASEAGAVSEAFADAGIEILETRTEGDWALLLGLRREASR